MDATKQWYQSKTVWVLWWRWRLAGEGHRLGTRAGRRNDIADLAIAHRRRRGRCRVDLWTHLGEQPNCTLNLQEAGVEKHRPHSFAIQALLITYSIT
ncbi:hypothetical protein ABID21_000041 [Pseudorhizobium tarimense]|uniref:Uncharacterized protein n=1 Tax=Pseudorhizobium tarimense TaxID=1079109 RepID=A0ABV2H094_9HYPH|nr:hypothetical protein [Pseudorhizobium tarimense]MCJ8517302.1 hypothetical protein [Pseudorhizobium tarimense]